MKTLAELESYIKGMDKASINGMISAQIVLDALNKMRKENVVAVSVSQAEIDSYVEMYELDEDITPKVMQRAEAGGLEEFVNGSLFNFIKEMVY